MPFGLYFLFVFILYIFNGSTISGQVAIVYSYIMEISIKVPADLSLSFPLQACGTPTLLGMASASGMILVFFSWFDGHLAFVFHT